MSREGVALPGTGAPSQEYDRMNEAQYRAAVEQALARLSAAIREIEELSDDLTITGEWTFDPGPITINADGRALDLKRGYEVYSEATGGAGGSGTRLWLDTDDQGDVVVGPRDGAHVLDVFRFKRVSEIHIEVGDLKVGTSTGGLVLPVGADRSASGGDNGSVWVEGTDLHYIDSSGTERAVTGSAV